MYIFSLKRIQQQSQTEIWKDIIGYEGLYQISTLNRFKSLSRFIVTPIGKSLIKERILKPHLNNDGYFMIGLRKDNKQKLISVHRLVALNFIPNPNITKLIILNGVITVIILSTLTITGAWQILNMLWEKNMDALNILMNLY